MSAAVEPEVANAREFAEGLVQVSERYDVALQEALDKDVSPGAAHLMALKAVHDAAYTDGWNDAAAEFEVVGG